MNPCLQELKDLPFSPNGLKGISRPYRRPLTNYLQIWDGDKMKLIERDDGLVDWVETFKLALRKGMAVEDLKKEAIQEHNLSEDTIDLYLNIIFGTLRDVIGPKGGG